MFKIFFEDIEVGETDSFGSCTVTKEEVIEFASKYDPQPFHLNEEFAKQSVFGALCASGWHTGAMTMRMFVDRMMEQGFAGLGSPGIDNLRWVKPVFPGDILSVKTKVLEKKDSASRPNLGFVKQESHIMNQHDETVMTLTTNYMVAKRPS